MGHIFLSYAREDLDRARTVAAALQKAGLSVWWDRQISGGSEYSREIEQALKSAEAVVVLWSSSSVDSPWVRDEAAKGRDSDRLIPATLDGTEPPLGFGQLHTIDLRRLSRRRSSGIQEIIAAIRQKVGGHSAAVTPGEIQPYRSLGDRLLQLPRVPLAAALLVAGVLAALVYLSDPFALVRSNGDTGNGGAVAIGKFEPLSPDQEAQRVARLAGDAVERTFATNFIETLTSRSARPDAMRNADFGLNGTVDRQGEDLIASANIIDSETGRTLWSTERARSADEGRQLANELAIWVADVLRCAIYAKSKMQMYRSAEVQSRILRWCEAERSRGEQFDQMPAIAQELVEAAPKSGQAHAYLALGLELSQHDRRQDIYSAANRALQLDPDNGVARVALAAVPDPRVSLAQREQLYREAMRVDPGFMYSRAQLAFLMMAVGRMEEATNLLGDLVSDYPLDYFQRGFWAFLLAQSGDLRNAREQFELIEQLRPGWRYATRDAILVEILFGDPERARPLVERWKPNDNDAKCIGFVVAARAKKRSPTPREISANCGDAGLFRPDLLNALFGNIDEAYAHFRANLDQYAAIPRFGPRFIYYPGLEGFRADPRFMPLMARFGYAQYWLETGKWPDFCAKDRLPYDCRKAAEAAVASARSK